MLSFSQEPIYNINEYNLHLLNYADYKYDTFYVSLDNTYEFYSNNKQFNSTDLNLNFDFKNKFQAGINAEYNYLGKDNNIANFDAILKYKYKFNNEINVIVAGNIGFVNSNIDYLTLRPRYSFFESTTINNTSFTKQNLNLGMGITFNHSQIMKVGLYLNHLNTPTLPFNKDRIPIKYTAFIRSRFGEFSSLLIYSYQDAFLYNPMDLDYYFKMLNYLGLNLNYQFYYPDINIGLGYKYLFDDKGIYSISASYGFNKGGQAMNIFYSFSLLQAESNNKALFHQFGIYFYLAKPVYRLSGLL